LDLQPSKSLDLQDTFKILIIGEIGVGKTKLTVKFVKTLITLGLDKMITIIDLAPNYKGVGLPMDIPSDNIRCLRPITIYAPRLMGTTCEEIWKYAKHNAMASEHLIREYIKHPTPILVMNDLTIYLHAGSLSLLYEAIKSSKLFIGNAYYGLRLKDKCGLWERERTAVEKLIERMDIVCHL